MRGSSCRMLVMIGLFCLSACGGCEACNSRVSKAGKSGELVFEYAPRDGLKDFSRPLALGAKMRLQLRGTDDLGVSRVESAQSSAASILEVRRSGEDPNAVDLTGLKEGRVELTVEAKMSDGSSREDAVNFSVAQARRVDLWHLCSDQRGAAYVAEHPIELGMQRYDSRDRRLVGQGACGVTMKPEPTEASYSCLEGSLRLPTLGKPGPYLLETGKPHGPDRYGALEINVVDAQLVDFAPIDEILEVNRTTTIDLEASTPDWPICHGLALAIRIQTPDTCTLGNGGRTVELFTEPEANNVFSIRGREEGDCIFSVALRDYPTLDRVWDFQVYVEP